ncbi:hypothetical protein FPCIR_14184, partial [Fusarium pseudocircinatum]
VFMSGDVECKSIPGWEDLDFSKLKILHISQEIPSGENGLVERHLWAIVQHFAYGIDHVGKGVLCWPIRKPSHEFPELTDLTQKGNIFPQALAHWLLHLKSLQHLECDTRTPQCIRRHSQGLRVDLDDLHMEGDASYCGLICKDASIATERHKRDMSLEHWEDVNYGMEAHFYGEMPLGETKALLYCMGQWEPEDEEDNGDS